MSGTVRGAGAAGWTRRLWGVVVPVLFAGALGAFLWAERASLAPLREAPAGDVLLIAVLFAVGHLLNSTEFWLLFRATGSRLGPLENWMLFTAGQLANHLPAQVGTVYRFRYMRHVHGVSYAHGAAVYGANLLVTFAGAALVGLVGVVGAAATGAAPLSVPLLLLFGFMAVGAVVGAVVPLPRYHGRTGRLAGVWRRFHEGFEAIQRLPGTALLVVGLEAVKYVVTAWRLQVAFALLAVEGSFWVFLVLAPAVGIASFIAVTPAALGFREAFVTGAAVAMGMEVAAGLLGATVDRAVMFATFLLLGGLGLAVTYPRLRAARASGAPPAPAEPTP